MRGYKKIPFIHILGAPVYAHSAILLMALIVFVMTMRRPLEAITSVFCYLAIVVLHETGHAFVVRRLGYRAHGIYVSFFHGYCTFDLPYSEKEHCQIAWGGALAQLAIALPFIVLANVLGQRQIPVLSTMTIDLGYLSFVVAIVNLLPLRGFDGRKAWKLIPLYLAERSARVKAKRLAESLLQKIAKK